MSTWPRDASGAPVIPTRVLTLYAPWLYAILHFGKDIENRGRSFPGPSKPEWVWLHASKSQTERQTLDEFYAVEGMTYRAHGYYPQGQLALHDLLNMRGRVCGLVEIGPKVLTSASPWFVGSAGLPLGARVALPVPSQIINGALGLWSLPDGIGAELAAQAGDAP